MQIKDQDQARNWAAKQLNHPYVLVDAIGNIHCCATQADMAAVKAQKDEEGLVSFIVKGELPVKSTQDNAT